ncbi:hypothetical protein DSM104299_05755 [Baekduia alba]|uniref:hypothetical protein n=1 Tax=Baekduia alba TaxID=2997333 RepID=UPI0023415980|nr:hypothetical protein [Baekduia alba]WCB96985.1 hypothetical protein DSM104299_05755 [Baekduia alba]
MILAESTVLPDNAGYVAAAYLVFLALLVIYVGIMAYKLINVQRDVAEISDLVDRRFDAEDDAAEREREGTPA